MFPCIKMFEGLSGTIALSNSKQNVKVFFFSVNEKQTQDNLEGKCSSLSKVTLKLLILCMLYKAPPTSQSKMTFLLFT